MLTVLVAVLPAVVGLLGGIAAGLIPSLVLTGRGRRVRAVRDAADLVKEVTADEVKDPAAEAVLRLALLNEALEYKRWVEEPPIQRRSRIITAVIFGLIPVSLISGALSQITGPDISRPFTITFSTLFIAGAVVTMSLAVFNGISALALPATHQSIVSWTPFPKTRAKYRNWKARRAGTAIEPEGSTAESEQSPPPTDPAITVRGRQ